ncbi:MAG: alpha-ketoglutarate-dependent dioxygenase AlkB [Candidatus Eremiobacteraeota bacterium]|nr:alpha-ketoglutarate-dependent dioxygenase AlkB [Candidatus Eremiobacteraeota bacterium]
MAQQIELFEGGPKRLADGPDGTISYFPRVFDAAESAALFDAIVQSSPWSTETMWMYDKLVDVPRLVARYAPEQTASREIEAMRARVESVLNTTFNSVGLNYYRDERDSVAWHNDQTQELVAQPTIALVSLGAMRPMHLRPKRPPRKLLSCDLEPGSLLVMSGKAQHHWEHSIPKMRRPTGPRISIAFRQRRSE